MRQNCQMALAMPTNCVPMNEDEMSYVEGGKAINLTTQRSYLSKKKCKEKAKWLLSYGYCNNMDLMDIAKEIHGHAFYGYNGYAALKNFSSLPFSVRQVILDITYSGLNGIALQDHKDTADRVLAYNLAWPLGKA